jgi:hypothetical protein
MTVSLTNGDSLQSSRFSTTARKFVFGNDTLSPTEIRSIRFKSTWPEWSTVGNLAVGGAVTFGTIGLIIDGIQGVGGSGWNLGATSTGGLLGAAIFGGLGIWLARERYEVLIREGVEDRTVETDKRLRPLHDDSRASDFALTELAANSNRIPQIAP